MSDTMRPIAAMELAVGALVVEVPGEVWDDVRYRWNTARAQVERLTDDLLALHTPSDEEAEFWFDQPGHREQFPECKTEDQCEGHTVTIQVCRECGYEHDDGYPVFRAWPCPTRKLVEAFRG